MVALNNGVFDPDCMSDEVKYIYIYPRCILSNDVIYYMVALNNGVLTQIVCLMR